MIIKPALAALLLCTTVPTWALCPYPLDATAAEIAQLQGGQTYQGMPAISGQTAEFTVVESPGVTAYGAASDTGVAAILQGEQSGQPMGDVSLPATGTVHIRMRVNAFPWGQLTGSDAAVWQIIGMTTGNTATPLPKESLSLTVGMLNSNRLDRLFGKRVSLLVNGQSISGSDVGSINRIDPAPLPFPADVLGFWINMDTRQIGLSVHIVDGSAIGLAPGDYDLEPLQDAQGQPYLVPAGVNSVSLMMVGILDSIEANDPLIGAPVSATLETDHCGSSGPAPVTLPGGKLFKGKPPILPPGLMRQMGLPVVLPPAQ